MILEVADIRIKPGSQSAFDAAIKQGVETVISKAKGYRGHKVQKGIESPDRYLLMIYWDTVEKSATPQLILDVIAEIGFERIQHNVFSPICEYIGHKPRAAV